MNNKKNRLSMCERIGIFYILGYLFIFLINHIWNRILKFEPIIIYIKLDNLLQIATLPIFIWLIYVNREKIIFYLKELWKYFKGRYFFADLSVGWFFALIFLVNLFRKADSILFFLTISTIYITLAGFTFTAGSFYKGIKKSETTMKKFFRLSVFCAVTGFLNIIFYLSYELIVMLEKYGNITGIILAIYLVILGFLFWVIFTRLIYLLIETANKNEKRRMV